MMRRMPRVPPLDRPATYDDLRKVPDIYVAEIVGGQLHATPRPAPRHIDAGSALGMVLGGPYQLGRGGPGGWWILDEPQLHVGPDVLVPDLAGWRRVRMPRLPDTSYFSLPPDWVCEILSPATASFDRDRKMAVYAREGVPYAWLVDPIARTLEVLRLDRELWTIVSTHADSSGVCAQPFTDVAFDLGDLWAEP